MKQTILILEDTLEHFQEIAKRMENAFAVVPSKSEWSMFNTRFKLYLQNDSNENKLNLQNALLKYPIDIFIIDNKLFGIDDGGEKIIQNFIKVKEEYKNIPRIIMSIAPGSFEMDAKTEWCSKTVIGLDGREKIDFEDLSNTLVKKANKLLNNDGNKFLDFLRDIV